MRAQYPLATLLSAAALLAACDMSTSPDPLPEDTGPSFLTVAPSYATVEGERVIKLAASVAGSAGEAPEDLVTWTSSDSRLVSTYIETPDAAPANATPFPTPLRTR